MQGSIFDRRFVIVAGKGGVGKSTIAAALALFSTTADSWASVLGPIQVVTILAAGFLLVPMVLGELLHVVGQSHEA